MGFQRFIVSSSPCRGACSKKTSLLRFFEMGGRDELLSFFQEVLKRIREDRLVPWNFVLLFKAKGVMRKGMGK